MEQVMVGYNVVVLVVEVQGMITGMDATVGSSVMTSAEEDTVEEVGVVEEVVEDRPQYQWVSGVAASRSLTTVVRHTAEVEGEEMDTEKVFSWRNVSR